MSNNQPPITNTLLELNSSATIDEIIEAIKNHQVVKKFKWNCDMNYPISTLAKILNLMPHLEVFYFELSFELRPNLKHRALESVSKLDLEREKLDKNLSLLHLKSLSIATNFSVPIYNFFTQNLPQNQLIELSMKKICDTIYYGDVLNTICEFIKSQKNIKRIKIEGWSEALNVLHVLNLDELSLEKCSLKDYAEHSALSHQKNLKKLVYLGPDEAGGKFLEDISKLSQLECLKVKIKYDHIKHLNNLTNLKELKLETDRCIPNILNKQLLMLNLGNIEKFSLRGCIDFPEIFECFPNVKKLEIQTSQKLNLIAKKLTKIEELDINFSNRYICELDTAIKNDNLKHLKISIPPNAILGAFFEVFPNVENLRLSALKLNFDANLLKKVNKLKNLKSVIFGPISIKENENLEQLSKELKNLRRNVDKIYIYDFSYVKNEKNCYTELSEKIKDDFDVNYDTTSGYYNLDIVAPRK